MVDSNPNILIVDDEAPIREMVRMALEMAGFDCLEAEDAVHAHSAIVDKHPDRAKAMIQKIIAHRTQPEVKGFKNPAFSSEAVK